MTSRFAQFVDDELVCAAPVLPLAHTTLGMHVESICDDGLKPRLCEVFDRDLHYTFYGRAEYRPKTEVKPGTAHLIAPSMPVCFLIKPDTMIHATDMHPFDTGAYVDGHYGPFVHFDKDYPKKSLEEFRLTANSMIPQRFVTCFFENNNEYVNGSPRICLSAESTTSHIDEYMILAGDTSGYGIDGRKRTLEIIFNSPIPIDPDHILCVFYPFVFKDKYRAALNNLNGKNVPTKFYGSSRAKNDTHIENLQKCVTTWLAAEGYLPDVTIPVLRSVRLSATLHEVTP